MLTHPILKFIKSLKLNFPYMIITGVNFRNRIEVDDSSILADHVKLFEKVRVVNSSIGEYSYIQENTLIANAVIDRFCSIGGDCRIGLVNHPTNYLSTSPVFYDRSQPLPAFLTPTILCANFLFLF